MAFRSALISALAAVIVAMMGVLLAGSLGRVTIDLPGVLELRPSTAGPPGVELWFNLLVPLVLVLVVSVLVWSVGRAIRA